MISVFSNYLNPLREENLVALTDDCKISEIYDWLRITYNQGAPGILNDIRIIAPIIKNEEDEDDYYDILYTVWDNEDLTKIVRWINEKITLNLGVMDYRTIGVRIAIADNMLIKLVEEGSLLKKHYNKIHYFLCNNTWNEISLITNENLPF